MTKRIKIPYFPPTFKYVTPLFFAAGIYLIVKDHPAWGVVLCIVGAVIFTTKYVTEINLQTKEYSDYLSVIGIRFNEEQKKFNRAERIEITKDGVSRRVVSRVQDRQYNYRDYTGTLIFDDNSTLDLITSTDKKELITRLKEFSDFLNVEIVDLN